MASYAEVHAPYTVTTTEHESGVTEQVEKFTCQIRHTFTGIRTEVLAHVDELFAVYHPLGYGTLLVSALPTDEKPDECVMVVTRSYTCD